MSFSYANPGSGPSAGGIGWFNFGNLTLNPGDSLTGLTGTLNDGTTVTFDLSSPTNSSMIFDAIASPTYGNFGYTGYTGILGNVLLQNQRIGTYDPSIIKISNVVVKDSLGNPVSNYTTVVADAEDTNIGESWKFVTDGGVWNLLTTLGNNPPPLTGLGTQTVDITGTTQLFSGDYVFTTQSPKNLTFTAVTNGGLEAIAIGFAVTKVTLCKNIGDRIDSADQFVMNIAGTPNAQTTTTGSAEGLQSPCTVVYGIPGNTYTINESMAAGSVSPLTAYTQTVSAVNQSVGGTIPPTGSLPINFTPALGDVVKYTILNSAPQVFQKSVDKTFAQPGDILTYTVTGINPNNYPLPGVVFTDPPPSGTTYIGNLIVSVP
ncbi:MAG: CshA/CshB family fibrillar adhesin-related protein, partial [Oscillospiraceae bacterium]